MTLQPKNLISLILCMALILNVGCQNVQRSENANALASRTEPCPIEVSSPDPQSPPEKLKCPYGVVEGIGEFITDTANDLSYIAVGGAVGAIVYLEYESWRILCEAF